MNWEEKICSTIISGLRAGKSVTEISKLNNLNTKNQITFIRTKRNRKSNSKFLIVIVSKFPVSAMVLGLINNKAEVMATHFFAKGLEINTDKYLKVLK